MTAPFLSVQPQRSQLQVNGDRLNQTLAALADIGKLPNGGVCRLAFSAEDVAGRRAIQAWMEAIAMTVRTDAAGNLIGTYPGQYPDAPALATGSHLDTVPVGGRYDGALGIVAGIEVARTLHDHHLRLRHPLEVIIFADEEASMIGAKAMAGIPNPDPQSFNPGTRPPIQACLAAVGGNWDALPTARRSAADMAAFVELHVEQGGVLEALEKEIGIITGIVSQQRYTITVTGQPNHAGTTPMSMRQDALTAAARMVLAVEELARNDAGDPVATVGSLTVAPNAANIIPGEVTFTVDIRDISQETVDRLGQALFDRCRAIATATHTELAIQPRLRVEGVLATPAIQEAIAASCQQFQLSHHPMPSRASHDAQEIARFTDMGTIFVPSRNGISHSALEYTSPEQCTQGANVLLHTLLRLDEQYSV